MMKKNTSKLLFILALGFASNTVATAQENASQEPSNGYVRCYTTEHEADLKAKYPNRQTTQEFESWLAPQIEKIKADRRAGKNIQTVYNIPVVIHIIHDGDAVGSGENITDAQAISQITVMNQDYRRMASTPGGANTTNLAVDVEINFVLAQKDPAGNPSTGIVRHTIIPPTNDYPDGANGNDWELKADVENMKSNTQWDPTKYLNMWTIRPGGNSLSATQNPGLSGLLGYAQFPSTSGLTGLNTNGGLAATDGVIAAFDAMGTNAANDGSFALNPTYNLGRTMTHEVGHWLGLRHIWGDNNTCPAANTSADKDFCADTPAANAPNYACTLTANTCPTTPGNDQVQNYMDYTNDACMDTFTNDQKTRMQTVMAVADRRGTLNASTTAIAPSAGIYYKKIRNTYSPVEATNCSYTDISYPVAIIKAPSANAVVTFNVNPATTAVVGKDFDIMTPTVTLATGATTPQNLTVRYYNDGVTEATKKIVIGMTVNASGGDAVIIPGYGEEDNPSLLTCTILDNDVAHVATQQTTVFSENFDGATIAPRTLTDRDGDTKNWGVYSTSAGSVAAGIVGKFAGSVSYQNAALTPDNLMTFTNAIAVPVGAPSLSFTVSTRLATDFAENYAVYVTTSNDPNTIVQQNPVFTEIIAVGKTAIINTVDLSAFAGQNIYLSFRHFDCTDQFILMLDDIKVYNTAPADIQVNVNTATQYQASVNIEGTVYAKDATTSKAIADLISTTNFDYGCTTVAVTRDQVTAGATAVNYAANTANNQKVMAKTVTVTAGTNNAAGAGSIKFYISEAEIAAWETATGNSRTALKVIKQGTASVLATTAGTFGPNTTLTATISNGLGGVYYFGTAATLGKSDFEFENFSMYPNPNKGNFVLKFTPTSTNDIKINVCDISGREVYEKSFSNTGAFNQNINLNKVEAGIYLVSISDGAKKTVKRIVVE
ncbi:T9SS-dependent choice-of-anchor J family protein [Flavobacterium psychrophilum]|nr:T9SS type A sorting domain-containing protein [Flavobacterium psychrophilum]AIJ36753.1 Metalloprotease mep1 [Flavobacterium psychrophilum]MCB5972590.1 T9SS type A sorting domain-containing protein [Flavobacterium psychrophilum]MCB5981154.1 T9SS type A sorting domain-containing protein [Flavobacterium psychrophilum]MCB5986781.1 T9SS type A sorting domain-containing protein [Flavobacterium psychrophilum]MCB5989392.1 T9SS type A sorting domain-containing protein [Flavobacterium psychrophilum]